MVHSVHQYITEGKECLVTAGWGRSVGFLCGLHKHHDVGGIVTNRWGRMSWLTTWSFLILQSQGCWSTSSQLNKVENIDSPLGFFWLGLGPDVFFCFFSCLFVFIVFAENKEVLSEGFLSYYVVPFVVLWLRVGFLWSFGCCASWHFHITSSFMSKSWLYEEKSKPRNSPPCHSLCLEFPSWPAFFSSYLESPYICFICTFQSW